MQITVLDLGMISDQVLRRELLFESGTEGSTLLFESGTEGFHCAGLLNENVSAEAFNKMVLWTFLLWEQRGLRA